MTQKRDKADTWMPWYVGDYLADTTHLSRDQHGGYMLLLMAMWKAGGRLPDDDGQLANVTKASARDWRALRPVMSPFFAIGDGWWTQKRLSRELDGAARRKAQAVAKAIAGAAGRWGKDASSIHQAMLQAVDNYAPSIPQAMPQASQTDASSNPQAMLEQCPSSSSLYKQNPGIDAGTRATPAKPGHKNGLKIKGNGDWRTNATLAVAHGLKVGIVANRGEKLEAFIARIDAAEKTHE